MNNNWKEQAMGFGTTPLNLNKWANEKRGKTHKNISDESVQKRTSLNRNSINMRDRPNTVTRNSKEQIVELNKLMRSNMRISTPTNGSTGNEWHNVIRSNDILFTSYPTLHKLNVGRSGVDKEVWIELSNQRSRRRMLYL